MAYSGNPKDYAVAVLYGGTSGEREVSLNSGKCCGRALEEKGFSVTLLDPASRDDLKRLIDETFDVAFLALHGKGGEDGTLQGFLETLGIPYTGSGILANAIAINKGKSKELYESAGLRVAASVLVGRNDVLDDADRQEIVDTCGIPCVVKPSTEGSSLGMTIVRDAGDLQEALDTALAVDDEAMVEQFIDGIELTVGVMGSDDPTAFPVIQILSNSITIMRNTLPAEAPISALLLFRRRLPSRLRAWPSRPMPSWDARASRAPISCSTKRVAAGFWRPIRSPA